MMLKLASDFIARLSSKNFTKIDKPGKKFVPLNEGIEMSAKTSPVLAADLNHATGEVINRHNKPLYVKRIG